MEKTALNSKAAMALKILAGTGAIGGAGVAGGMYGYRRGATNVADAMSKEFIEQNARENQSIANSFKAFNAKENNAIAQSAFMKGVQFAMNKESNWEGAVTELAFNDELEKLAGGKTDVLNRLLAGYVGATEGAAIGALKGAAAGGGVGAAAGKISKKGVGVGVAVGGGVGASLGSIIGSIKGARKGYLAQKATESPLYKVRGYVKSMLGGKKTKELEKWIKKNPKKTVGAGALLTGTAAYGLAK